MVGWRQEWCHRQSVEAPKDIDVDYLQWVRPITCDRIHRHQKFNPEPVRHSLIIVRQHRATDRPTVMSGRNATRVSFCHSSDSNFRSFDSSSSIILLCLHLLSQRDLQKKTQGSKKWRGERRSGKLFLLCVIKANVNVHSGAIKVGKWAQSKGEK